MTLKTEQVKLVPVSRDLDRVENELSGEVEGYVLRGGRLWYVRLTGESRYWGGFEGRDAAVRAVQSGGRV